MPGTPSRRKAPVTALRMAAKAWCAAAARLPVLPERDIADIMMHFYGPVAAEVGEQVSGARLVRREAGDAEDGDRAEQFPVRAVAVPFDEEHLPDLRPFLQDLLRRREGLDGAGIDAAVAAVDGPGLSREGPPGQRVGRVEQFLLVIADGEDEEGAGGLDLLRVLALRVHLVCADDGVLQVAGGDLVQEVAEDGDLVGLLLLTGSWAAVVPSSQSRTGASGHGRRGRRRAAPCRRCAGACACRGAGHGRGRRSRRTGRHRPAARGGGRRGPGRTSRRPGGGAARRRRGARRAGAGSGPGPTRPTPRRPQGCRPRPRRPRPRPREVVQGDPPPAVVALVRHRAQEPAEPRHLGVVPGQRPPSPGRTVLARGLALRAGHRPGQRRGQRFPSLRGKIGGHPGRQAGPRAARAANSGTAGTLRHHRRAELPGPGHGTCTGMANWGTRGSFADRVIFRGRTSFPKGTPHPRNDTRRYP